MNFRKRRPRSRTVATIGYQGHGKTSFLAGLFWDCFFSLPEALKPFHVLAVNEESNRIFLNNAHILNARRLPLPNQPSEKPKPAILEFSSVPVVKSGRLQPEREDVRISFYDMSGEPFEKDSDTSEVAPFLRDADDLIFLFDPTSPDSKPLRIAELVMRVYRVSGDLGSRSSKRSPSQLFKDPAFRRKNIIIAYTKLDEMYGEGSFVRHREYPLSSPSQLPAYLRDMQRLSDELRDLWGPSARQNANVANFLSLQNPHYCRLSALGEPPFWRCPGCSNCCHNALLSCNRCQQSRGKAELELACEPKPMRVHDPLFWIFHAAGVMH